MDRQLQDVDAREEGLEFDPRDLIAIWKRRKWHLMVPAVMLLAITGTIFSFLPPVYRSEATILIEQPNVPPELVSSTVTSYAQERIQKIKQRFLATDNLVKVIDKYDLYPEKRKTQPLGMLVQTLRDDVDVELITQRQGRVTQTIAFTVAFNYGDPHLAQRVANELVAWYLSENARTRRTQAAETATFLANEAKALEREIAELENKITAVRKQFEGSLPEHRDQNLQALKRAEQEHLALELRTDSLRARKKFLETELSYVETYRPTLVIGGEGGSLILNLEDQIEALRMKRIMLSSKYTPQHPEMVALRNDIQNLEAQLKQNKSADGAGRQTQQSHTARHLDQEEMPTKDPSIKPSHHQITSSDDTVLDSGSDNEPVRDRYRSENPRYAQILSQIEEIDIELKTIEKKRQAIKTDIAEVEQRIAKTPEVENRYNSLFRAYEHAQSDYLEVRRKQLAAELGESLEKDQKSERFSLVEPPQLPTDPIKPKKLLIFGIGFVLSLGAGLGTTVIAEVLDPAVHGSKKLAEITGVAPLVAVPYIQTPADNRRAVIRRTLFLTTCVLVFACIFVLIHTKFMPLDVIWSSVQRRLESWF